jgi:hypothetical protein
MIRQDFRIYYLLVKYSGRRPAQTLPRCVGQSLLHGFFLVYLFQRQRITLSNKRKTVE